VSNSFLWIVWYLDKKGGCLTSGTQTTMFSVTVEKDMRVPRAKKFAKNVRAALMR